MAVFSPCKCAEAKKFSRVRSFERFFPCRGRGTKVLGGRRASEKSENTDCHGPHTPVIRSSGLTAEVSVGDVIMSLYFVSSLAWASPLLQKRPANGHHQTPVAVWMGDVSS